jgi:isopenicillin-N epimerase
VAGFGRFARVLPATSWLVDPDIAYLNHGGFGALPVEVADAAAALRAELEANPTDLLMRQWPERIGDVRAAVAELLRAAESDLVFVPNATTGTATVLASLAFQAGDEIVITDHRYPAVASQTAVTVATRGVAVVEVPVPLGVTVDDDVVNRVVAAITPRTKLVVVDHIASPTGFLFPVAKLARAAHEAGIPILVDAAHAPGQVDVDLAAIDADFWVGNLHKWVCSPRAAAVMRVAPRWHDLLRPLVASRDYADGFQPAFDWTGTLDPVPLLTIPAALRFWEQLGWDRVRSRQHDLASEGAHVVAAALGTRVAIADEFTAAMRLVELPVRLDQIGRTELVSRLTRKHGVTVHVSEHQQTTYIRLCGQLYNRPQDYERLASALLAELGTDG